MSESYDQGTCGSNSNYFILVEIFSLFRNNFRPRWPIHGVKNPLFPGSHSPPLSAHGSVGTSLARALFTPLESKFPNRGTSFMLLLTYRLRSASLPLLRRAVVALVTVALCFGVLG